MFALLKLLTHMSFGGIGGRAFNQEVHRGFHILGGSGYLSISLEEMPVLPLDSNLPAAHEALCR